mmetsp:Transcript_18140/g.17475  ORF Transcript_18140/g.17475 Transcript_18140/m.17475 type:complete len:561 (+) Transcript_18140:74-1756(+)|eukprot:CAMPEP_0119040956 /NCGR_PEP_ID=MMETSP1177-20130426/11026_1 /TAXON_ID=2985 /ORGANISM="Ochromonas sp, Strain CCMP1899" /LENGTH=560 /DNA_ID=CAMNT_0007006519 /DNA_START=18 /DNA_END=1700 /DNA_ORIENTATION=+
MLRAIHSLKTSFCHKKFSSFRAASALELVREGEVKNAIRTVVDPASGRNLVATASLQGIVIDKDQGVRVDIELYVPGHPFSGQIKADCLSAINHLPWVKNVDVKILRKEVDVLPSGMGSSSSLSRVKHVIAVSSCKGGVGKSTVAVNLASELVKRGLRVGLLDADIYGPSLPLMVEAKDLAVQKSPNNPKWILPLEATSGLKILSFGHVNPRSGAPGAGGKGPAVMRGPIATRVINQLVAATEWGDLDYLIVDMPPGTGDIQITLSQAITFTGAVIVTTPHELSLADATKGVAMFEDLRVPTLAVVENMSYFECDLGTVYYPFGIGGRDNLLRALSYAAGLEGMQPAVEKKGCGSDAPTALDRELKDSGAVTTSQVSAPPPSSAIKKSSLYERLQFCPLHCLPLSQVVSGNMKNNESETDRSYQPPVPVVLRAPDSKVAKVYKSLADDVIMEILKLQLEAQAVPSVSLVPKRGLVVRYYTATKALEYIIPAIELRLRDPSTGSLLANHLALRNKLEVGGVEPLFIDFKGNYGIAINWNDGYFQDIYPYDVLKELGEERSI